MKNSNKLTVFSEVFPVQCQLHRKFLNKNGEKIELPNIHLGDLKTTFLSIVLN